MLIVSILPLGKIICRNAVLGAGKKRNDVTVQRKLPYNLAIPFFKLSTKNTGTQRNICTLLFIATSIVMFKTQKKLRCPVKVE